MIQYPSPGGWAQVGSPNDWMPFGWRSWSWSSLLTHRAKPLPCPLPIAFSVGYKVAPKLKKKNGSTEAPRASLGGACLHLTPCMPSYALLRAKVRARSSLPSSPPSPTLQPKCCIDLHLRQGKQIACPQLVTVTPAVEWGC